ncbi:MAG TPA: acyl-CoA dehydrogenase family protein [Pirellulales bacterium]|nr:acyl-CoA dehydrogenase family protein [Pirellulales bacterium]
MITSPDDPSLGELCAELARGAGELDRSEAWPHEQLQLCGQRGVYEWFMPRVWGGQEWSDRDITRAYLRLGAACLTTAFIITQRTGACLRVAGSENEAAKERWLGPLTSGETFATVGISHLTTSRRHVSEPVLRAREVEGGFVLDGYSPWVTGAGHASMLVTGAVLASGQQILLALPTDLPGVSVPPPHRLVGLSASHTGEVRLEEVQVSREWLLAGPAENVMKIGVGAGTGGLQTSTLAIALAAAAIEFLEHESLARSDLAEPAAELGREQRRLQDTLLALAGGERVCTNDQLRAQANSIALRAAQAALAAAKGAGYVVGHPAGRWCREALFFLVWSCPQGVMAANLCELAGLD